LPSLGNEKDGTLDTRPDFFSPKKSDKPMETCPSGSRRAVLQKSEEDHKELRFTVLLLCLDGHADSDDPQNFVGVPAFQAGFHRFKSYLLCFNALISPHVLRRKITPHITPHNKEEKLQGFDL
jgi:hypothetical protein